MRIEIRENSPHVKVGFAKRKFGYIVTITYLGIGERYTYKTSTGSTLGVNTFFTIWKGNKIAGEITLHGFDKKVIYQHFVRRSKNEEMYVFLKTSEVFPATKKLGILGFYADEYDISVEQEPKKQHLWEHTYINGVQVEQKPVRRFVYTLPDGRKYVKHGKTGKRLVRLGEYDTHGHYNNYETNFNSVNNTYSKSFEHNGEQYKVPKDIYKQYIKDHWKTLFPDELE